MRGLAFRQRRLGLVYLLLLLSTGTQTGCGGRDARDIASDLEGTVSSTMADRLLRDVDLQRSPVTVSVDNEEPQTFGPSDQQALEGSLREAIGAYQGDRVQVTQQVVEDTGADTQQLTVTLSVEHQGQTQYVPMTLDLQRDGRRMIVTRVRVMGSSR